MVTSLWSNFLEDEEIFVWIGSQTLEQIRELFLLNSKKYKILEDFSEEASELANMKNIFGVLSDAFSNSAYALLSLIPLLSNIIKREKILGFREIIEDIKQDRLISEQTLSDFVDFFNQFINNTYQISSLIVWLAFL